MSLALYRKYRPQSFEDVIGQEATLAILKNALKLGRLSHAYLFTGPRGSGKTTIARLLAKAVNCQTPKNGLPCDSCSSCTQFFENRIIDLVEIDAASNRGIDEMRDLRDGIKFTPLQARYKVFIIDEVHMLTKEAFNALLKTLEEPPEHAIFILATTEIEKVPATIISRCQRFDFKRIVAEEIYQRLTKIAKSEKAPITPDALRLIAHASEGSARDAESLLGQVISGTNKEITVHEVEQLIGRLDIMLIVKFMELLAKKDTKESIAFLNHLLDEGQDLYVFTRMVVQYIRRVLVVKTNAALLNNVASDLSKEQQDKIVEFASIFSLQEMQKLATIFLTAQGQIQRISVPILALELAVVEYTSN